MNKEQREELKRLAAEATPGPWINGSDEDSDYWLVGPAAFDEIVANPVVTLHSEINAAYIAAANPQAITALLASLEAAEAENERLRKAVEDVLAWRVNEPCRGDLRDNDKSRDALSALVKAMEAK